MCLPCTSLAKTGLARRVSLEAFQQLLDVQIPRRAAKLLSRLPGWFSCAVLTSASFQPQTDRQGLLISPQDAVASCKVDYVYVSYMYHQVEVVASATKMCPRMGVPSNQSKPSWSFLVGKNAQSFDRPKRKGSIPNISSPVGPSHKRWPVGIAALWPKAPNKAIQIAGGMVWIIWKIPRRKQAMLSSLPLVCKMIVFADAL